ncbi:preprotein translocase subunit YajC [Desertihabitans brevis]|uniref:Preprotein translocase subunit YajC n=1 Tax=Desertihabitans brevis TaxID=2268447 RepID=A0A367YZ64_9ACTN|nr:preprotein translocase subunit YajC [Desertihabitans brevis]RCK71134.1 preprotein translocase subunit YajC [Desertihabitans brevis]
MDLLLPVLLLALVAMLGYQTYRQSKRMKQQREAVSSLAPGTRVMLSNGFVATVVSVADTTLDVELAPGVVATVVKQAYGRTLTEETEETATPLETEDESPLVGAPDVADPADTEPPTHRVVRDDAGRPSDEASAPGATPGTRADPADDPRRTDS